MSHALNTRVTSLAASALLVSAALVAAVSARYVVGAPPPEPDPPPITSEFVRPPPVDPPIRDRTNPPRPLAPVIEAPFAEVLTAPDAAPALTEVLMAAAPAPPTITNPEWRRRPRDLARYYPAAALRRRVEGLVVLECVVGVSGALGCVVAEENPGGWGFGAAALEIAGDHQMAPALSAGRPVEARYRMRIPFAIE